MVMVVELLVMGTDVADVLVVGSGTVDCGGAA
jgi:hypothetical protein